MSWEKFGSPYDPNHSGKMKKPSEKEDQAAAETQWQTVQIEPRLHYHGRSASFEAFTKLFGDSIFEAVKVKS